MANTWQAYGKHMAAPAHKFSKNDSENRPGSEVVVLPLSMMDHSVFSPHRLTVPIDPVYPTLFILPFSSFQGARILLPHHVFLLLLLFFLILSLSWLWHLSLPHHCLPHSRTVALHTAVQRLRHHHAPHAIVQPGASPPLSSWGWSQRLCAPGMR